MKYDKYYKEVYQVSYDGGITWIDYKDSKGKKQYRQGEIYGMNLPSCSSGKQDPKYRDIVEREYCQNFDLYNVIAHQESTDGGVKWYTTGTSSVLVEENSPHCGYPIYRTIYGDNYCDGVALKRVKYDQVSNDNGATWQTQTATIEVVDPQSIECGYDPSAGNFITYWKTTKLVPHSEVGIVSHDWEDGEGIIKLDPSLQTVPQEMFRGCIVPKLEIGEGFTIIGDRAFLMCNVGELILPQSLIEIGSFCVSNSNTDKLRTINSPTIGVWNLPENLETIKESAFDYGAESTYGKPDNKLILPKSIKSIGANAFRGRRFTEIECHCPVSALTNPNAFSYIASNGTFHAPKNTNYDSWFTNSFQTGINRSGWTILYDLEE